MWLDNIFSQDFISPVIVANPLGLGEVMFSILGLNYVIAKVPTAAMSVARVGRIHWPITGTTHYHAQLGLSDT